MSLQLSCYDAISFPLLTHGQALRLIADLGVPFVDVCVVAGLEQVPVDDVVADPTAAGSRVGRRLEEHGLRAADVIAVWGPFDVLAVNHPDQRSRAESRDRFQRLVEFASRIGARGVTVLPGIAWPGESRASSLSRATEELAWRAEAAKAAGLRGSFEPHLESITETVDETLFVAKQAPGLTVNLDYAHFVCQGVEQSEIERLHPVTGHLQGRQAAPGMLQAPASEGTIDFARVIRLFEERGLEGFFSLEYCWDPWRECDRVDVLSESILLRDLFLEVRGLPPAGDL